MLKELILCISLCISVMMCNLSTTSAATTRVVDGDAQTLVEQMQMIVDRINEEIPNYMPVKIQDPHRATNLEKNYNGYSSWTSELLSAESNAEFGQINLYTDEQGYIPLIDFVFLDLEYSKLAGMVLGTELVCLGVTDEEEINRFMESLSAKVQNGIDSGVSGVKMDESIYCGATNRYLDFYIYDCDEEHIHFEITARN